MIGQRLDRARALLSALWMALAALVYFGIYAWNALVHWLRAPELVRSLWRP